MLIFFAICAAFVALALWFVLPPLFERSGGENSDELRAANLAVYQDQFQELESDLRNGAIGREQYEQDKDELGRRLLEDVAAGSKASPRGSSPTPGSPAGQPGWGGAVREGVQGKTPALVLAMAIPAVAVLLYFQVGKPRALSSTPPAVAGTAQTSSAGEMTNERIEANVASLAKHLEQNPNDAQGWIMLARSYSVLGHFGEASSAFAKATALVDNNADLWADYAEALAMSNGQQMAGTPIELVNKALQLDPQNRKALALAGAAAFEAKDFHSAIDYWERLLRLLPAKSELAKTVSEKVARARALAGAR